MAKHVPRQNAQKNPAITDRIEYFDWLSVVKMSLCQLKANFSIIDAVTSVRPVQFDLGKVQVANQAIF